ncbi:NADH dehydrogenase I subunit N [Candidatus Kinetoplastibacterium blastocrithidii TCC012E]|uniref:NADH-quinone oxidoreductase subunit N n=1 Tax=Candidatus Kinetoplastidibacterium blastocrithidiae TCC012E TaxID=1208922 RepID=M1M486_9PROT|nr:NADH-quinone oxidoreductase subunit N [Candidatus Kinetoplastibacterium blastocrithidii]AFZ83794.1 NADH-quinone oxidoreductase subunit N [Candidatus Kinetoplastibacterium blastocrithidii (ex Strigomonas culicis)]AGF49919.1 NADH dehydrogenase I subunit N [Candidatus Kinetoplastibacterium blastocrithidii TCC012E]
MQDTNFFLIVPEITLLFLSLIILVIDIFSVDKNRFLTLLISLLTLIILTIESFFQIKFNIYGTIFGSSLIVDYFSHSLKIISYLTIFFMLIYSKSYVREFNMIGNGGEFYVLLLLSLLGQMVMISSGNLMSLYLGIELMSLPLYAMIAIRRNVLTNIEASIKYFVLGSVASGIFLYGVSIIYGVTNSLDFPVVSDMYVNNIVDVRVITLGFMLLISGLIFKFGIVPFHMWLPDVYQGSPTVVTLFLGTVPKLAIFAVIVRLFVSSFGYFSNLNWNILLISFSLLSLCIGNITAIMQKDLKRMLAYSAISHMGFVLLGLVSQDHCSSNSITYSSSMYYIIIYLVNTMAIFGSILLLSKGKECVYIDDLIGLKKYNSLLAFIILVSMFSLAGLPPFIGFYAKLVIFKTLINSGYVFISVIAVLFSLIGAFYYLRVIKISYFNYSKDNCHYLAKMENISDFSLYLLSLNLLLILFLSIFPDSLLDFCIEVVNNSFGQ